MHALQRLGNDCTLDGELDHFGIPLCHGKIKRSSLPNGSCAAALRTTTRILLALPKKHDRFRRTTARLSTPMLCRLSAVERGRPHTEVNQVLTLE